MTNRLLTQKPVEPTQADTKTNALLSECGDVLGEMFHPAFIEVAFWARHQMLSFVSNEGVAHGQ